MAGKNTAVFGIYKSSAQQNAPSIRLQRQAFHTMTFRCCCPTLRARKSSHMRRTPKLPKEQPQE